MQRLNPTENIATPKESTFQVAHTPSATPSPDPACWAGLYALLDGALARYDVPLPPSRPRGRMWAVKGGAFTDFDKIVLKHAELSTLRKSNRKSVSIKKCERLLRFRFVEEEIEHVPGYQGKPLGTCRINNSGKDYLVYWENRKREERKADRRYWITTIIAIAALLKSFAPEISAAMALLWKLLARQ